MVKKVEGGLVRLKGDEKGGKRGIRWLRTKDGQKGERKGRFRHGKERERGHE